MRSPIRPTRAAPSTRTKRTTLRTALSLALFPSFLLALLLLALLLTGCGISPTGYVQAGAPAQGIRQPGTATYTARIFFLSPLGIHAAARPADGPVGPQEALDLLVKGPTEAERARGLVSVVPQMPGRLTAVPANGAVSVYLPMPVARMEAAAVHQIACTAGNAALPGGRPATEVDVRMYEPGSGGEPWTVRCSSNGIALPATGPEGSRTPAPTPAPDGSSTPRTR
ncbi:hypothetical protein ACH4GK_07905 [Streptomyces rimosus]|uniref:hypothetical protein n=1 Tax=Streptomyces rimosus TaxID=1927 RepID=UPI0004C97AF1|nr:hypothetical protein [Streptomyces rimosus]